MTLSPSDPAAEEPVPGDEAPEAAEGAPAGQTPGTEPTAEDAPDEEPVAEEETEAPAEPDELAVFAAGLAERIGATSWTTDFATVRLRVDRERWVAAVTAVGEELPFFSWLSAIDWSRDVTVGEPAQGADDLDERYEVLCRLSSVRNGDGAVVVTTVPKDDPAIDSLVGAFGGAEWHEREAAEMFGIEFRGHPNLTHLYLPDAFEGHPLRKSFALLSREVKPWPGTVDVEGLPSGDGPSADGPSTENVEAGDEGTDE